MQLHKLLSQTMGKHSNIKTSKENFIYIRQSTVLHYVGQICYTRAIPLH